MLTNESHIIPTILPRFGRIKGMMLMLSLTIFSGLFAAFAPNFVCFLAGVSGCGFATIGYGTIKYCWMMELISGNVKTVFGCMPQVITQL